MSRFFKSAAFPILIVVVLAFFAQKLISPGESTKKPTFSQFLHQIDGGQVKSATLKTKDNTVSVTETGGQKYEVGYPNDYGNELVNRLQTKDVKFNVEGRKSNGWLSLLTYVLPFLIFIGFWIFLMNQVQGGGSKVMSFGKSRAKRLSVDSPKITFRDVAGVDEAVEELHEIKEFLENPKKFQALGEKRQHDDDQDREGCALEKPAHDEPRTRPAPVGGAARRVFKPTMGNSSAGAARSAVVGC